MHTQKTWATSSESEQSRDNSYPAGLDKKPLRDIAYKYSTYERGRVRGLGSGRWVKLQVCSSPFMQQSITFQMK